MNKYKFLLLPISLTFNTQSTFNLVMPRIARAFCTSNIDARKMLLLDLVEKTDTKKCTCVNMNKVVSKTMHLSDAEVKKLVEVTLINRFKEMGSLVPSDMCLNNRDFDDGLEIFNAQKKNLDMCEHAMVLRKLTAGRAIVERDIQQIANHRWEEMLFRAHRGYDDKIEIVIAAIDKCRASTAECRCRSHIIKA